MLVSDLVNQYHNTLNSGSKIATKTKGIEQLSKTVASLEKGQIFEGTVKAVKGDKVTLSLSSGQNITARLDKSISLEKGQSVFFQVKSNEGGTVQIKPVSSEFGGNPTLLNALKGAGLPENEANLKLVNSMMKEQMPIDKASIQDMVRTMRGNPGADIDTLVSLKKLDLPVNDSMITQFENYKASEGAILKMVGELSEEIPKALSAENVTKEDVINFQKDLLNIVSGETSIVEGEVSLKGAASPESGVSVANQAQSAETVAQSAGDTAISKEAVSNTVDPNQIQTSTSQAGVDTVETVTSTATSQATVDTNETGAGLVANREYNLTKESIGTILNQNEGSILSKTLSELPGLRESAPQLFTSDGQLNPETKSADLLKTINNYFEQNPNINKAIVMKFLESAPTQNLLKDLMGKAWTMEPKDLLRKNSINELYEKIEKDMERVIESSKASTHQAMNPIAETAQGVKDNISFIREVNQLYQYVQIPLQMSGENTTGELYVYSNKKQKRAENDEITAFLHFDMENLGSTDISVKLAGKKLDTQFFLEDDISYNLIAENLHFLEERLAELGYNCTLTAKNDSNKVDFVEDFLKQDVKTAGDIRRYSFDVRA